MLDGEGDLEIDGESQPRHEGRGRIRSRRTSTIASPVTRSLSLLVIFNGPHTASKSARLARAAGSRRSTVGPESRPSLGVTVQRTVFPRRATRSPQHVRERRALHRADELAVDAPAVAVAHDVEVGILGDERRRDPALRRRPSPSGSPARARRGYRVRRSVPDVAPLARRRRKTCRRAFLPSEVDDDPPAADARRSVTRCANVPVPVPVVRTQGRRPLSRRPLRSAGGSRIRNSPSPRRRDRADLDARVDDLRPAHERPRAAPPGRTGDRAFRSSASRSTRDPRSTPRSGSAPAPSSRSARRCTGLRTARGPRSRPET